ncbi:MAG: hypothetical protein Faunusvirus11_8 [Faunusvirus sp.]|jgi:ankyrin repeat protein|uniref:Uncharacterized protein n=1 Tax=Faunusvirus sp. TaxID=2487766 RepID=A0A3G5A1J4_9VIRU|nr:MAG: hypothetical protein Faunusvirus11_8 [Faunusvirus sp.]
MDASDRTPLMYACIDQEPVSAMELINRGDDLDMKDSLGHTAIIYACMHDCKGNMTNVAKAMINKGCKLDETALMLAIDCFDDDEIALLMIERGADIYAKDECGHTALNHAWLHGKKQVAAAIISRYDVGIICWTWLGKDVTSQKYIYDKYHEIIVQCINNSDVNNNALAKSFEHTYVSGIIDMICNFIV